ncbi:MAG: glycoside hydrolase family 43 protein [Tannerella sp.]|jgi:beta-xylosidase|nr:glycoside hydrolase family 43 protein [Tannerella sp.]
MKPKLTILFLLFVSIHLSAQQYSAQRAVENYLTDENPADGRLPVQPSSARQFTNPVIPGDFADPTIIRMGNTYFAAGTSSEWAPHYPVFESKDLINWSYTGPAFATKPEWTKGSFWAPELFVFNEKVYLYYTARRASDGVSYIGVAVTDDIRKGFQDYGCLVEFGTEAIDAFVFEDEGKLYVSWKAYGLDPRPIELLCAELSSDGLKLAGEPFMLLKDEENIGMEGQYMYKEGNYYYIIYSILGCCGANSNYAVCVARSESLRGPYEKYEGNPILQGDGETVLSCGHGTVVEAPDGKTLYLFHAYLKGAGFYNGRQAFLKELAMNENGWPYFITGKYASVREPMPFDKMKQNEIPHFEDYFAGNVIRPEWSWNFTFSDIRTKIENNTLFLTGAPLKGNEYGTALCLRTLKPDYEITTEIKDQKGIFSGLTLYGDKDNLVILGKESGHIVLKQIRKGVETLLYQKTAAGNVHLKIAVSNGCRASFFQSSDRENWTPLPIAGKQETDVSYLPPWDRAFRPGLIHIGSETVPAEFTYCKLSY